MELMGSGSDCVGVGETELVLMKKNEAWEIYMYPGDSGQTECNVLVAGRSRFVHVHGNLTE